MTLKWTRRSKRNVVIGSRRQGGNPGGGSGRGGGGRGGGGGGSGPFTPGSLSSIAAWWSADVGTYEDDALTTPANDADDAVGGWDGRSPTTVDLVQATAAQKPLLKLTAGPGAGRALLFDGNTVGSNQDALSATTAGGPTDWTVFAIVKLQETGAHRILTAWGGTGISQNGGRAIRVSDAGVWEIINAGLEVILTSAAAASTIAYQVVVATHVGATGASVLRINSAEVASGTNTGLFAGTALTVGGSSLRVDPWIGHVFEVGWCSTALSGSNLTKLESYLTTRAGL
jgi:hypothetical protein